jgi:tetratricopeptide (TPR) repeat protein
MALFGRMIPVAGALLVAAASLGAQTAAATKPACDADATKGGLAKAAFAVEQARTTQGTPSAVTSMTSAVKQLEAIKGEDPTIQALFLGQSLAFWLAQPNMSLTPRRGTLGFVQNPESPIDLVVTIDSLFKVVETAKPGCRELTNAYRGGLPGYLALVNGAISALNADKLDSAEMLASKANVLYPSSPYGTMVLGSIASKRNNSARALEYWSAAAASAAKDTIYRDVQRQVLGNQGSAYLMAANAATGAERAAAARKAIEAYNGVLSLPGTSVAMVAGSRTSLQNAQLLMGDTAAFVAGYQPLIANPAAYGYLDLLSTGVAAARANRTADAAKLLEGALVQNPWNRDALFNLAVMQLALDQNDRVPAVVERLVAVDPGNPENFNLAARAYQARAKAAQAAKNNALAKAMNDTTVLWYTRGNRLPVEITFTEFTPGEKSVALSGTVLDRRDKIDPSLTATATAAAPVRGAKAKAPAKVTLAPQATTIRIEALDKSGAVLGTQTVTTEALTPGKTANFNATIDAPNAVAFRYTIVS